MEIFHDLSLYLFKESEAESRYQHQKLSIRVVSWTSVWFKTYGPWTWEFISKRSYSQNSFFIPLKLFHDKQKQPPELFLEKGVLKICSKFTGEHSCRSAISIRDNTHMTFMKIGQFSRRPTVKWTTSFVSN